MPKLEHFDSFSGYGGFSLAVKRIGGNTVGFSEIDKYAIQTYEKHFPNIKNYGDISKIETAELPFFNLLTGGTPCQDLSVAGKRAGLTGERSGLFFHFIRLLKERQPDYFIWENVKGALSSNDGWDFAEVQNQFSEAGYDFTWQLLNAKHFGVPQNRERIFVIGHLRGKPSRAVFFDQGTNGKDIEQIGHPIHSNNRIYGIEGIAPALRTMQGGNRQPKVIVPTPSYGEGKREVNYSMRDIVPTIRATQHKSGDNQPKIARTIRVGGRGSGIGNKQNWDSYIIDGRIRRLTVLECERLMGLPDAWTDGVSMSQRYKLCGNGVVVNVVEEILKSIYARPDIS